MYTVRSYIFNYVITGTGLGVIKCTIKGKWYVVM